MEEVRLAGLLVPSSSRTSGSGPEGWIHLPIHLLGNGPLGCSLLQLLLDVSHAVISTNSYLGSVSPECPRSVCVRTCVCVCARACVCAHLVCCVLSEFCTSLCLWGSPQMTRRGSDSGNRTSFAPVPPAKPCRDASSEGLALDWKLCCFCPAM